MIIFIFALISWIIIGLWGSGWAYDKNAGLLRTVGIGALLGPLTVLFALKHSSLYKCWTCGEPVDDTEVSCRHCHALRVE